MNEASVSTDVHLAESECPAPESGSLSISHADVMESGEVYTASQISKFERCTAYGSRRRCLMGKRERWQRRKIRARL